VSQLNLPGPLAAVLDKATNPLGPIVVGLVLLAKRQPEQLHSAIQWLSTVYDFVSTPENLGGVSLVSVGLWIYSRRHGNAGPAFKEAVAKAVAEALRPRDSSASPPAPGDPTAMTHPLAAVVALASVGIALAVAGAGIFRALAVVP
jgi:hypothetical protein